MTSQVQNAIRSQVANSSGRHRHEVHSSSCSIVVDYKCEFDGQQLNCSLGYHENKNEDLFGSWNFQLLEHILEDEGDFGTRSIEEEQPGQEGQVEDTENNTESVVA